MNRTAKARVTFGIALALGSLLIPLVLAVGVWKTLLAIALTAGVVGGALLAVTAGLGGEPGRPDR